MIQNPERMLLLGKNKLAEILLVSCDKTYDMKIVRCLGITEHGTCEKYRTITSTISMRIVEPVECQLCNFVGNYLVLP